MPQHVTRTFELLKNYATFFRKNTTILNYNKVLIFFKKSKTFWKKIRTTKTIKQNLFFKKNKLTAVFIFYYFSCHDCKEKCVEIIRLELITFYMQSKRSTIKLYPLPTFFYCKSLLLTGLEPVRKISLDPKSNVSTIPP